ncbi:DUF31 family protein [Mycoplasmoides pneumoniae]|uniref:Uncharacterized protein MPN_581 n=4 Tax=Mycoplasmoides pneumoniae TaxID=2104 RepID=Y581_MYCPN|nr:DUF31 family protein [Mycoplasmoides pneumoniae]P75199.1 RecName: Full=Uncharacterized protein MPN_581 [Mycoplasmoides pneumoniae M129]AAB95909.1 conserved hypothetical protein [Mycoplasmoides pneumoniae M129]ADK87076.1 conserved hypothetical protein [Mycoplasmoides pneumoniae FH]AJR19081.1 hypothetical protein C985_01310 [Mycoplasmoides pneumoniae M129-B7]ALA30456.1 hypothetical protein C897_03315 [Mycoplasmoides pneumoniae PI 1428]ALA30743.1 hypothetical protein B434_00945 [Mycoplasmoide
MQLEKVPRAEYQTKWATNTVPKPTDFYHQLYNLSFSLTLTSQRWNTYGTGWLIDWKDTSTNENKFTAYLATNFHVADTLKNPHDYPPYNQVDNTQDLTTSFRIGKYTDPSLFGLYTNVKHAFVDVQLAALPKMAYAAVDFVDYRFDNKHWKSLNEICPEVGLKPYADFAVLEVPLYLNNKLDYQVWENFIKPAIATYKALGDSTNLFASTSSSDLQNDTYFALGYPLLESNIDAIHFNQTGATLTSVPVKDRIKVKNQSFWTLNK